MTQVAYVATATRGVGTNSSVSPTIPSGLSTGDLMLCIGQIAAPARTFTQPTGWSTTQYFTNTSTNGPRIFVSWKAYAGETGTVTFTAGGTSLAGAGVQAQIWGFSGADTTTGPTFGTAYSSGSTTGTAVGPVTGVAVSGLGLALVCAAWASDYTSGPTQPSGWTIVTNNDTTTSTVNVSMGLFRQNVSSATTSSVTVSGSPSSSVTRSGIQIALNEASTNLNKLMLGSSTVGLDLGSVAASKAYMGSAQVWP